MEQMHRIGVVLRKRYRHAWWRGLGMAIAATLVMLAALSIPFYLMVRSIEPANHFPPKTVYELLEAIRPQIVQPEGGGNYVLRR